MSEMILNKEQALAVANAMVHMNNVTGRIHARMPNCDGRYIHVVEHVTGEIQIYTGDITGNFAGKKVENYRNQNDFIQAYNLW
jgi:hypothetical protein